MSCKYCGASPLWWIETANGYRLADEQKQIHSCEQYARTTEERERVTHLFTVAGNNFARRLPYFMMMDVRRERG